MSTSITDGLRVQLSVPVDPCANSRGRKSVRGEPGAGVTPCVRGIEILGLHFQGKSAESRVSNL
jgi:hypothetical protein